MLKVCLSLAFLTLVAGQITSNHSNVELIKTIHNNSSLSSNLTTESKKIIVHEVDDAIVINRNADEGSEHNPFEPANLTGDDSIGNFKYYFILLAFSSLSVIAIIIFKAIR